MGYVCNVIEKLHMKEKEEREKGSDCDPRDGGF